MVSITALALTACLARAQSSGDGWITNTVPLPLAGATTSNAFSALRAEAISGQLQITWSPSTPLLAHTSVALVASAGSPGHWTARDWRSFAMNQHGAVWQANIPVESLDVPIAYFVAVRLPGATNVSPVRVCHPRRVGLEEPSKFFWPFLEGFEQGVESWRMLGSSETLQTSSSAKNGRNALALKIPADKRSVTVATTRVRGWSVEERAASGLAFWARTTSGTGQLRCTFLANAFTTNQVAEAQTNTFTITPAWKRFQIAFADFPLLLVADLDLVAFEWIGTPRTEFLLDDLYLLGRWRFE